MVKDDVSTVTNRPAIKPVTGAIWSACGIQGNVSRDDLTALQEADRTQIIVAHGWMDRGEAGSPVWTQVNGEPTETKVYQTQEITNSY